MTPGVQQALDALRRYVASEWPKHAEKARKAGVDFMVAAGPAFLELAATLPQMLVEVEADIDRKERLHAALELADLFEEKLGLHRLPACWLALEFAGETDLKVAQQLCQDLGHREEHLSSAERERARELLLKSAVTYEPINPNGATIATHEMWFLDHGAPRKRVAKRELGWGEVPGDVREAYIRDGASRAAFTIYLPRS